METYFLFSYIILFFIANFNFGFLINGFNRSCNGIYNSGIDSCVINFDLNGNAIKPFFHPILVENNVFNYCEKYVKKYSPEYEFRVEFYDHKTGLMNTSSADEINIYIDGYFPIIGKVEKSACFYIEEGTTWTE